jgi:ABC-2 type transport system ATP-binding protein
MIEARDLTKRYRNVTALNKVRFDVKRGEVLGFLGPNGAGKTTAMKILTCFIAPSEGSAKVNGHDIFADPNGVRASLGYLPEANPLYKEMLVYEYLRWVAQMRRIPKEKATKRLEKVAAETGLTQMLGRQIATLSKGYRQRVGLAQALIHEPPILILDEPMSGLDPNQTIEIRDLIKEIGRERTVIFSSHNLAEVSVTCDRVLIVSKGRIVADDKPNELRARAGKPTFVAILRDDGPSSTYRENAGARAAEVLKRVRGVADVREVPGAAAGEIQLEIIASGADDLRAELFAAAAEAKLGVLELYRKDVNLEAVFRELTALDEDAGKKKSKTRAEVEQERRARADARRQAEEEEEEDEEGEASEEEEESEEEESEEETDEEASDEEEETEEEGTEDEDEEASADEEEESDEEEDEEASAEDEDEDEDEASDEEEEEESDDETAEDEESEDEDEESEETEDEDKEGRR